MSGPKYSHLQIERERQRLLEMERQRQLEEERRRLEEERKRNELNNQIQKLQEELKRLRGNITYIADEGDQMVQIHQIKESFSYYQIQEETKRLLTNIEQFPLDYDKQNISNMEHYLKQLQPFIDTMRKEIDVAITPLMEKLHQDVQMQEEYKQRQQFLDNAATLSRTQQKNYTIPKMFKEKQKEKRNINHILQEALQELEPYIQHPSFPFVGEIQNLYDSIRAIAAHPTYDDEYKEAQIKLRLNTFFANKKKYDEIYERLWKEKEEYGKLLVHYQTLCQLLNIPENEEFFHPEDMMLPEVKERLKAEIARLDQKHAEQQEINYIVNSVHEVMQSLGYEILATDYMVRKKQNVHHHIYELGFEQAVNVFISDNGSILFEVSGVSNGPKELSSLEKLKVKEAMEAFCTKYEEIKEGLKQKGIHLCNENLSPADERYVRNIDISQKNVVKPLRKVNNHHLEINKTEPPMQKKSH